MGSTRSTILRLLAAAVLGVEGYSGIYRVGTPYEVSGSTGMRWY